ncbi:MAG: hypothetical protein LC803_16795 [Acidobacteria bacterium]|nr:hypothetical protein [Acidobacteriota bacterium]
MKPHDCTVLNDAQCLHADHFFLRLAHWRDGRGLGDEMCIRVARGDAQRKYPLREHEQLVMDEYQRERVEVLKWPGARSEPRVETLPVDYVVR